MSRVLQPHRLLILFLFLLFLLGLLLWKLFGSLMCFCRVSAMEDRHLPWLPRLLRLAAAADDLRYPSLSLPLSPSLPRCLSLNNEQPEGERKQDRQREGRQSSATQNAGAPGGARSLSNNNNNVRERRRKKERKKENEERAGGGGERGELSKSWRRAGEGGGDAEAATLSPLPLAEPQKEARWLQS